MPARTSTRCPSESQLSLFDRPAPPLVPVDPRIDPVDVPRLSRAMTAVLDRLRKGPATTLELIQAGGGLRAAGRVHDLREAGYGIEGKDTGHGIWVWTLRHES